MAALPVTRYVAVCCAVRKQRYVLLIVSDEFQCRALGVICSVFIRWPMLLRNNMLWMRIRSCWIVFLHIVTNEGRHIFVAGPHAVEVFGCAGQSAS